MADVIEIVQGTATVVEVAGPTGPQGPAGAAGATGAQGPQGAPGTGLEVLTTQGDLLYQGGATGERLPIGTAGQVLKVVTGEPAWANESGAVVSVNGETGTVVLDAADVGAAPATGIDPTAITGTAVVDNDARLSDTRDPNAHAGDHAAAGSDPVFDQDLNTTDSPTFEKITISGDEINGTAGAIHYRFTSEEPISNEATPYFAVESFDEDTELRVGYAILGVRADKGFIQAQDGDFRIERVGGSLANINMANAVLEDVENGTTATFDAQENLSDDRVYTLPDASGTLALTSDIPALGTAAGESAEGDHTHGNLSNSGSIGSTSGLPVVTTASGAVTALALGSALQVLRVNSGGTAVEFAAAAGGGVTGAAASASDVLGVSGSDITGVDANADRIVFWDDSASALKYLEAGSGLSISGTTLTATATGTIGGATGSVDNALLRANGTGGATVQGSALQLDDAVRAFSVTGDASTDVITATDHNYVNGQVIRFVGLAGGGGLSNATNYFVRDAATNQFKVATTSGGAAVNFTTNITSGSAIAQQESVTLRARPASFAFTADASTDVITATGHTFIEHDPVSFFEVVGGAGINPGIVYHVRDISGDTFKISTSAGGAANNITTDYTGGNVELVAALVLTAPKNAGFIVGPKPDGTTHGGNTRGQGAIDIQPTRSGGTATRVASGVFSIAIGDNLTASNTRAIAIGSNGTTASGVNSLAIGTGNTATARNSIAMGVNALADRSGRAFCHHSNSASGHRQELQFFLTRTTTNDTAVEIWADEELSARVTIPSGKVMGGIVCVTGSKSDGSAVALYTRQFVIKNVGGTTTMPSQSTIGTDYEDNANTDITVEANDTNDSLRVLVKGISGETWRWTGWLHCTEQFYGT